MIRISNISFFRFCRKNEKLDWPKCARTLYELDLFKLNTLCNSDVNTIDNLYNQRIHSRYFSPHSFKEQNKYVIENDDDSFLIFHNNLISLIKNFENLQSSILDELVFNFNIMILTRKAPNPTCLVMNLNLSQRLSLSVAL